MRLLKLLRELLDDLDDNSIATVACRDGKTFVVAWSRTAAAERVMSGLAVLDENGSDRELVAAVNSALSRSVAESPTPDASLTVAARLFAELGIESWEEYQQGDLREIQILLSEGHGHSVTEAWTLTPMQTTAGRVRALPFLDRQSFIETNRPPSQIADAVREALRRCA